MLPVELWYVIFSLIPLRQRLATATVSREWSRLVSGSVESLLLFESRYVSRARIVSFGRLRYANLIGRQVDDDLLTSLPQLRSLAIGSYAGHRNAITDAGLTALTQLDTLVMSDVVAVTGACFTALTSLTALSLTFDCGVEDRYLRLLSTSLTDLVVEVAVPLSNSTIRAMTALTRLSYHNSCLPTADALESLDRLHTLTLGYSSGGDASQLVRNLTALTELHLDGVFTEWNLYALTNLTTLEISGALSVQCHRALPHLKNLTCW